MFRLKVSFPNAFAQIGAANSIFDCMTLAISLLFCSLGHPRFGISISKYAPVSVAFSYKVSSVTELLVIQFKNNFYYKTITVVLSFRYKLKA